MCVYNMKRAFSKKKKEISLSVTEERKSSTLTFTIHFHDRPLEKYEFL